MKSLAWVGSNIGLDVDREIDDHDAIWLFEPLPEVACALCARYSAPQYAGKAIRIIQAACWTHCGREKFNIYNTNGLSSSLGKMTRQAIDLYENFDLSLIETIEVQCTVLSLYLPYWLDKLMIDAQGADLTILRTVEYWLREGRIRQIVVECDGDGFQHYEGLGSNCESDLLALMANYPYRAERVDGRRRENPDWLFTRMLR